MAPREFSARVKRSGNKEFEVGFSESVCQDFARLHEMLKDREDFVDYDCLRHMEDFSNPRLRRGVPVAFAAVIEVFKQVTAYAEKTKNNDLIEQLDTIQSDMSGFGAEKHPLTVVSASPRR